eukprot:EG_transcript_1571
MSEAHNMHHTLIMDAFRPKKTRSASITASKASRETCFKSRRKSSMTMISELIKAHHNQDSPISSPVGKVGQQNLEALALASRGVETVLSLVRNALGYGEMLQMPCNALKVLSSASPTHRAQIAQQGGVQVLIECLRLHVKEPKIVVPVTRCLVNICGTPEGMNLLNRRGVQVCLDALTSFGQDPVIQQSFSRVLRHICADNPEAQLLVASEDGIARLLDTITRNPLVVAVHRSQFSVLVQLATNRTLAKQIVATDGFKVIQKSIIIHQQQIDVMTQCVGLLSFLTVDSDSCGLFLNLQGMVLITGLLEQYLHDDAVLAGLCRIIYNVIVCQAATDANRTACLGMVLQILQHCDVGPIVQTALISMAEVFIVRGQNLGLSMRNEAFTQLLATMAQHLAVPQIQERCCFLCADICLNWTQEFWRHSPVLQRVYEAIEAHNDPSVHDAALEALHSIARITDSPWEEMATERGIRCLQRCMHTQPADALASKELCCEGFLAILEKNDDLRAVMVQCKVIPLVVQLFLTQLDIAMRIDDIPSTTCCQLLAELSAGSPGVFEVMNEVERAGAARLLLEGVPTFQDDYRLLVAVSRLVGNLATQDSICRTLMVLGAVETFLDVWRINEQVDIEVASVAALPIVAIAAHSDDFRQAVFTSNALHAAKMCVNLRTECSYLSKFELAYLDSVAAKFEGDAQSWINNAGLDPRRPTEARSFPSSPLTPRQPLLAETPDPFAPPQPMGTALAATLSPEPPPAGLQFSVRIDNEVQTDDPIQFALETQTSLAPLEEGSTQTVPTAPDVCDAAAQTDAPPADPAADPAAASHPDAATQTATAAKADAATQPEAATAATEPSTGSHPDAATEPTAAANANDTADDAAATAGDPAQAPDPPVSLSIRSDVTARLKQALRSHRTQMACLECQLMAQADVDAESPRPSTARLVPESSPDALVGRLQTLLAQLEGEVALRDAARTGPAGAGAGPAPAYDTPAPSPLPLSSGPASRSSPRLPSDMFPGPQPRLSPAPKAPGTEPLRPISPRRHPKRAPADSPPAAPLPSPPLHPTPDSPPVVVPRMPFPP